MDTRFHIDFDWLGPADSSDADRVTFAALSIRVGGRVATRVLDSITKAECHSTHISAFRLAIWFAANWWRLRWEPEKSEIDIDWEMSHKMGAVGGGYLWPNLTVSSDGEEMIDIHSRRTRPSEYKLISYLDSFVRLFQHTSSRGESTSLSRPPSPGPTSWRKTGSICLISGPRSRPSAMIRLQRHGASWKPCWVLIRVRHRRN